MMKRFTWVFILTIIWSLGAVAKPVTKDMALQAARQFLNSRDYSELLSMNVVQERILADGSVSMYVINLESGGWILVSADDEVQPILAYSFESSFDADKGWTEAAKYLVTGYEEQIERVLQLEGGETDPGWSQMDTEYMSKSASAEYIDPIIDVKWNQSSGWNRFCPEDEEGPGGRAYVGCVAVSMAQAMSVYGYPVKGNGKTSYIHEVYGTLTVNFDAQDPYEWDLMSATSSDDYNAKVLYDAAVSVEMGFSGDGSGAYLRDAASSLVRYFTYSTSLDYSGRFENDEEWTELLLEELRAGRPIIYEGNAGDGLAGHAWNVDGYGDGYFHMNFGWSGSQNGYFSLDLIDPGSNDFSSGQGAITGITPPVSGPLDLNLSSTMVDELLPLGSFVAEVQVEDEDPINTYTYTSYGRWNPVLEDYGKSRFYVENDTLWTDKIFEYNDDDPDKNVQFLRLEVEDQYGTSFKKEFYITVQKVFSGPTSVALSDSSIKERQPVGTPVGMMLVEDEDSLNTYTCTLSGPWNPETEEYDPASFYLDGDTLKTNVIFDLDQGDTSYVMIELVDAHGNNFIAEFTIQIKDESSGSTGIDSNEMQARLFYPNPADQGIYLDIQDQTASVKIYELATGKLVRQIPTRTEYLDLSSVNSGIYLLVIRSQNEVQSQKLIIRH